MTLTVKHGFNVAIADDPTAAAAGEVLPSHWNSNHNVTGTVGPEIGARTILTANQSRFVSATGSDSNDGLTLGTAWATTQHAANFIAGNLDFAGFTVTVNIGTGTFVGWGNPTYVGGGILFWSGNGVANTTITSGPNDGTLNFGECATTAENQLTQLDYGSLTFDTTGTFAGIAIYQPSFSNLCSNGTPLTFKIGAAGGVDCIIVEDLAFVVTQPGGAAGITINGTGAAGNNSIWFVGFLAGVFDEVPFTITGTPAFTAAVIVENNSGFNVSGSSYTGAATGPRFAVSGGSAISGGSAGALGANFFPGNAAGTVDPSSSYDGFVGVISGSGLPTTTQFPDSGTGGLYKDTSGGGVYIVYNDAGTIKKAQLT